MKFNSRINNHNDYNNYIRSQQENAHENPMDYLNRRYTEESSRVLAQSQETSPPSNEVSNESFEALPIFIGNATGQGLLLSLLDEAQSRGFVHSLNHGVRTSWFQENTNRFFAEGGIFIHFVKLDSGN